MSAPVTLLMAIHCHQPVGNFDFVFEQAFAQSYDPFLQVLERHPGVRLALHYSGPLLDWLTAHQPAFLDRVRVLVARGQVELLGSGYYEPILPIIPERDRQGQIAKMRAVLRTRCGAEATGLWLTERVWEPDLPSTISRAGLQYTMVDTNQFLPVKAWLPQEAQIQDAEFWDVLGSFMTGFGGETVRLFPASKRLRYWMPFQAVDRTIDFLRRLQREGHPRAITFADDGEKFGLWPKTHQWVYREGWLDQFFAALEREQGWLTTSTFQDYVASHPPVGTVYLPNGSYEEMLEWSGGNFRNFFLKYPEANAIQQKMLHLSGELETALAEGQTGAKARARQLEQAREALYAGQCNCAYWHGIFGGLYLGHLRRALHSCLVTAERLLHQAGGGAPVTRVFDADGDGVEEIRLQHDRAGVLIDAADGGAITEWNLYGADVNVLDVLTRRQESYHEKLKAKAAQSVGVSSGQTTPASIHDVLGIKEAHLESRLIYDDHRRTFFLDYGLERLPSAADVLRSTWGEARLWSWGAWQHTVQTPGRRGARALSATLVRDERGGRMTKTIRLEPTGALTLGYALQGVSAPYVGIEFNLGLRDERYLDQPGAHEQLSRFEIHEQFSGIQVTLELARPATVLHFPVETISESEEGLERTYQGLCVLCFWPVGAAPAWATDMRWTLKGAP